MQLDIVRTFVNITMCSQHNNNNNIKKLRRSHWRVCAWKDLMASMVGKGH
jgi:hypothetical protein